jgi:ATP-dependent DNA ligase
VSPRTRKILPIVDPIVAVARSPPLQDPRWIYEPKFDGFRRMLYVCAGECYIRFKRNKVLSRLADLALRVGGELHARDAIHSTRWPSQRPLTVTVW